MAIGFIAACGGGQQPSGDTPGAAAGANADARWTRCVHEPGDYDVAYPATWFTNDGSVMPACSVFDPEPPFVPEGSEMPEDIAVVLHVEAVPFDSISAAAFGLRVIEQDTLTINGYRALRRLYEHTGEGLYDRGLLTWQYLVDRGDGSTLIATSNDAGDPPFDEKRRVLDAMMQELRRR